MTTLCSLSTKSKAAGHGGEVGEGQRPRPQEPGPQRYRHGNRHGNEDPTRRLPPPGGARTACCNGKTARDLGQPLVCFNLAQWSFGSLPVPHVGRQDLCPPTGDRSMSSREMPVGPARPSEASCLPLANKGPCVSHSGQWVMLIPLGPLGPLGRPGVGRTMCLTNGMN